MPVGGAVFDPVDSFAAPKWQPAEHHAAPVAAWYKVIVPTDLTSRQQKDGTWVPYALA